MGGREGGREGGWSGAGEIRERVERSLVDVYQINQRPICAETTAASPLNLTSPLLKKKKDLRFLLVHLHMYYIFFQMY